MTCKRTKCNRCITVHRKPHDAIIARRLVSVLDTFDFAKTWLRFQHISQLRTWDAALCIQWPLQCLHVVYDCSCVGHSKWLSNESLLKNKTMLCDENKNRIKSRHDVKLLLKATVEIDVQNKNFPVFSHFHVLTNLCSLRFVVWCDVVSRSGWTRFRGGIWQWSRPWLRVWWRWSRQRQLSIYHCTMLRVAFSTFLIVSIWCESVFACWYTSIVSRTPLILYTLIFVLILRKFLLSQSRCASALLAQINSVLSGCKVLAYKILGKVLAEF